MRPSRLGPVILSPLTFCIRVFVLSMCFCMQPLTTGSALSNCLLLPKSTQVIAQRVPKLPSLCLVLEKDLWKTKRSTFFFTPSLLASTSRRARKSWIQRRSWQFWLCSPAEPPNPRGTGEASGPRGRGLSRWRCFLQMISTSMPPSWGALFTLRSKRLILVLSLSGPSKIVN